MKRLSGFIFTAAIVLCSLCTPASATGGDIYVTISNEKGELCVAYEKISVSDTDGDGKLTVNDVLYAAHEMKYTGGAEAGYKTSTSDFGLGISKLWGVSNGGSYGYYVNNSGAMSLLDEVKSGDAVAAYVYTDTKTFSDTYCYFNVSTAQVSRGGALTLTLMASGYDENWNLTSYAVSGADILIDGRASGVKTSDDGTASIPVPDSGSYTISASSNTRTLVPPVCLLTVTPAVSPATSDSGAVITAAFALLSLCLAYRLTKKLVRHL